jgi:hypothetical protein
MKKKSPSQSTFFNVRVLIGLCVFMGGVFLALVSFGPATAGFAQGTTRGQMAAVVAQALNVQPPACVPGQEMFDDVPASNPFCPWIEELARRGITGGCAPNLYCPSASVTRAQMAPFILKATSPAFGRDTAIVVTIPSDLSSVQLTEVTVTPTATGSVLARARGFCNFFDATSGVYYNVNIGIGVDANDAFNTTEANLGVIGHTNNATTGVQHQSQYSAERIFVATAGVPITLRVFGRQEEGLGDSHNTCSAALTLQELPPGATEPAGPPRAPGGTTVSPTISR